jgi:hypothetical protein
MMHAITLLGARQLRHEFERYVPLVSVHIVPATVSTEPVEIRLFGDSPFDCARP